VYFDPVIVVAEFVAKRADILGHQLIYDQTALPPRYGRVQP
jgi:hypothetical protein